MFLLFQNNSNIFGEENLAEKIENFFSPVKLFTAVIYYLNACHFHPSLTFVGETEGPSGAPLIDREDSRDRIQNTSFSS